MGRPSQVKLYVYLNGAVVQIQSSETELAWAEVAIASIFSLHSFSKFLDLSVTDSSPPICRHADMSAQWSLCALQDSRQLLHGLERQ